VIEGPVLEVTGLVKHYQSGSRLGRNLNVIRAVDGVDLTIQRGEIVGHDHDHRDLIASLLEGGHGGCLVSGQDLRPDVVDAEALRY